MSPISREEVINMTQNQIAYQSYLETQRANRARESETHRSNVVNEGINRQHYIDADYASLLKALNNPFSIASHFAKGEDDFQKGFKNQIRSIFGDSPLGNFLFGTSQALEQPKEFIQSIFGTGEEGTNNPSSNGGGSHGGRAG